MPPNKALQTDKGKLSCLLHSQKPRQLGIGRVSWACNIESFTGWIGNCSSCGL
jgi:hypothetical protein